MSCVRYVVLSGVQGIIVLCLAITPVVQQALAQLPHFPYALCGGNWSDEVERVDVIVKCRAEKRADYVRTLEPPSTSRGDREFVLDPVDGTTKTRSAYSLRPAVQILVQNLNPYLFQYQVDVKHKAVVETAPADFFKNLMPSAALPAPSAASSNAVMSDTKARRAWELDAEHHRRECTPVEAVAVTELLDRSRLLETQLLSVTRDLHLLRLIDSQFTREQEVLSNLSATSRDIQQSALAAVDGLHDYSIGVPVVLDDERRVRDDVAEFNGNHAPDCASKEASALAGQRRKLDSHSSALASSVSTLDSVKVREAATSEANRIAKPLKDPKNFYRLIALDGSSGAEEVQVTVSRRTFNEKSDDGAKPTPYDTVLTGATRLGLPRFLSIGGGMTWFAQQIRTYAITRKYSGNVVSAPDSVISVISEQAVDSRRIAPMLTLGAELPLFGGLQNDVLTGIGLQFGITGNKEVSALEYFVGASVHLLDDRLFIAYGDFASKDQSLAAGYAVGDRIPTAQSSPPLVTRTQWHDAFMVGFRLY